MSVHTGGGGGVGGFPISYLIILPLVPCPFQGVPHPSCNTSTGPMSFPGGTPSPSHNTSSPCPLWGEPQSFSPRWGYPSPRQGGYPCPGQGIPQSQDGMGYPWPGQDGVNPPPPPSQDSCTCYAVGRMPLAVPQEHCLVFLCVVIFN